MISPTADTPPHECTGSAPDIEALAHEAQMSLEDVAQLYAHEWAVLAAQAQITTFLPILTIRKVRAILRQQRPPSRVPVAIKA